MLGRVFFSVYLVSLTATVYGRAPNIIWLQADSMDGRLLDPTSPYYSKVAMPNLKKLATEGVNFVRTYTTSPQCVPSRTSMWTSHYIHESNTWNNGIGIAQSTRTGKIDSGCVAVWSHAQCEAFATLQKINTTMLDELLKLDYNASLFGRFDIGNGILDEYTDTTGNGFHSGPDLGILARAADIRRGTKANPISMVDDNVTEPFEDDIDKTNDVVKFLQNHNPQTAKPWFLWLGILDPHPPYDTNSTYLATVNQSAVDVPPEPEEASMHPYDTYMSISKEAFGTYTPEQIRSVRSSYWGAVAEADALLGRVLQIAATTGHLDNTVVIYTSDHGEMGMEHRQDFKNSMYEPAVRVPLIITGYKVQNYNIPTNTVVTNFTSHLDIFPTLMDIAGGTIPTELRGYSLAPFLGIPTISSAVSSSSSSSSSSSTTEISSSLSPGGIRNRANFEYAVSQYASNMGNTGSFMIRQGSYKYIAFGKALFSWFSNYTSMLFNVDEDPWEMNNIIDSNPTLAANLHTLLVNEYNGRQLDDIDKDAKQLDLTLYNNFFTQLYTKAQIYQHFQNTYTGFNESDAEKVGNWCGTTPVNKE